MPSSAPAPLSLSVLSRAAAAHGLLLLGALPASEVPARMGRHAAFLKTWQDSGFAGEMKYMQRDPSLFADPTRILPEVRSIFLFAVPYSSGPRPRHPRETGDYQAFGKVARYAWGDDYHSVIRERLRTCFETLQTQNVIAEHRSRYFTDAVPILERSLAQEISAGFYGRNSLLIRRGTGSYFFLAEVVSSLAFSEEEFRNPETRLRDVKLYSPAGDQRPIGSECGSCTRCVDQCPTGAIVDDGVVDARRCISYLTIEKRTVLTDEEASWIGDWVFGCDICQDICPFNAKAQSGTADRALAPWPEFIAHPERAYISLDTLLRQSDDEWRMRFGKSAITRAGRAQLARNACAVASNLHAMELIGSLIQTAEEDPANIARDQALLALKKMHYVADGLDKRRIGSFLSRHSLDI